MHVNRQTHAHTRTNTLTHANTHTHTHTNTHTHTHTQTHTNTHIHIRTHTRKHAHTQTHIHAHKHKHAHTYTHTHTHTLLHMVMPHTRWHVQKAVHLVGVYQTFVDIYTCCCIHLKAYIRIFVYKYIHIILSYVRPHDVIGTLEQMYINTYVYTYHMRGLTGLRAHVSR